MANIQQQPQRPRMDHILLKELINGNAYERLEIVIVNPGEPDQVVNRMAVQTGQSNAERLLQGVTSDGDGVLHIAARLEDVKLVRAISQIWSNAVDVADKNKRGETALHCAAGTGNAGMVALLILRARDNDKKRQLLRMKKLNGETCLHGAARCGKMDAVKILVEKDAEVDVRPRDSHVLVKIHDNEGVSPLYLATTLRQFDIVKFLIQPQGGTYPAASYDGPGSKKALHAAVLLSKELSQLLGDWNNDLIDKADESGSMPLHILASIDEIIIMEILLDMDERTGYRADGEGWLPIHVAAANGSRETVKLLSERRPGCSWSCNELSQTILHIAVQNENSNVVNYVCSGQKFARIFNNRDRDGNTALHLAVLEGNQVIFCQLMRRREICLSVINKDERTPLDLAVLSIPPDISFSKTPRHWIMYALVVAGADYGIYKSDQLPWIPNVAKHDVEKETKSIGKSAGVLAVCALLILTTAFAEPLSVTKFYDKTEKNFARRFAYRIFVISDAMAFAFSVISIACCTLAGFSFANRRKQLFYLAAGLGFLITAAIFIILVFTGGLYLAVGSVVDIRTLAIVCLPGVLYPLTLLIFLAPASSVFHHTRALVSRLGCSGWSSALICLLPPESRDRTDATIRFRRLCVKCIFAVFFLSGAFVLYFGLHSCQ